MQIIICSIVFQIFNANKPPVAGILRKEINNLTNKPILNRQIFILTSAIRDNQERYEKEVRH